MPSDAGTKPSDQDSGPAPDGGAVDGATCWDAAAPVGAPPEGLPFPANFVFGTAIAGFQVDMGCPTLSPGECDDYGSDWYQFTTAPETVGDPLTYLSGQNPSNVGPGFWELWAEDIARADEQLHNQALRFSIEWSRVFPTPTDDAQGYDELKALANPAALARYHAILAELKRRGMRPLVTLYHYALPTWIHDPVACHTDLDNCSPAGWVDAERTLREIRKYAAFCAREFGAEIDWWATLNEPLQNMLFGYVQPNPSRSHPPAVMFEMSAAKIVFNALIEAHARMYDEVKTHDTVDADGDGANSFIGVVYPLVPIEPANRNSPFGADQYAAENVDYLWNRVYLNAVAKGQYDEKLDKNIVQREDLAGRMDYVGINYYYSMQVSWFPPIPPLSYLSRLFTVNPFALKELSNEPEKLKPFIRWVNDDLKLPVIITENGVVDGKDDGTAPRFLVQNLKAVQESITEGADVRGYFFWTLTDNYEWNHGMDMRMGMYAVSKDDPLKKRVARKAVPVFGEIAKFRVLPFARLDQFAGASP